MNEEKDAKKQGGQAGNQNARKHGFYSKTLTEKEQSMYENAVTVEGLDEEIALLRVKIFSIIEHDPENLKLITRALNSLEKLLQAKYNLGKNDHSLLKEGIEAALKGIALPLGIKFWHNFF